MKHLDWFETLKHLQSFATSGRAKMRLGDLQACSTSQEAVQSIEDVFDAAEILGLGQRPFMESLDLFEPWFTRIKKNAVLKTIELKDVRHFCLEALALHELLIQMPNEWSRKIQSQLMDASEPLSAIDQILTPGGEIRSDASETLYRLFREKENLSRQIETLLDRLVKDFDMQPALQDKYVTTREGRWVLPVKSGKQHFMPGVIHGSSQTKQTVFMEPESVVPVNNRLRQVEVEIEDEIERLLTELSLYLGGLKLQFESSVQALEVADLVFAKAQLGQKLQAQRFQFSEKDILLNDLRHPLLVISQKPVVSNSVQLDDRKSILLLSGPNAGGKTVLLKSIGLAAQMARCGLPICAAEDSQLPFFKTIEMAIGDAQNVGAELSTFAAHLQILEKSRELKGFDQLILIDEICGATDPEEGSALARAFIESYSAHQVFGIITSHLGPLKTGWKTEDAVLNGSMEYDSKTGRPTYQYIPGVPGDSMAIQTAKRVGVPSAILDRAVELLSPETRRRLSGLEEIDQLKMDMNSLREKLKKDQVIAQTTRERFEKLSEKLEKEKEDILSKVRRQAEKKVEELLSQAKAEQTFKKHLELQEIKKNLPEIVKSKPGASLSQTGLPDTADEFGKRFPPGSKVFVQNLGQDAIIQSTPNAKGDVMILSGSLRLTLPWKDLKPASSPHNPTNEILRKSGQGQISFIDQDRTLDFRGKTVEECLSQLEIELDQAAVRKEDRIKIIHGHGTDALKKAVRTYLSRSVYVKKWKAGSPEQGGDGVTWAELTID
ncbi:MAG: endonuclease MutS2 [Pseudobdellovibrionaceae bacterium]